MDIRALPLELFKEFCTSVVEDTERRKIGETREGVILVWEKSDRWFATDSAELSVYGNLFQMRDGDYYMIIIAGVQMEGDARVLGSTQEFRENVWIKWHGYRNCAVVHTAHATPLVVCGQLMARAVERARSGAFDLGSFWYDWKKQCRVSSPYEKYMSGVSL